MDGGPAGGQPSRAVPSVRERRPTARPRGRSVRPGAPASSLPIGLARRWRGRASAGTLTRPARVGDRKHDDQEDGHCQPAQVPCSMDRASALRKPRLISTHACCSVSTAHLPRDRPTPQADDAGRDTHRDGDGGGRTVQRVARSHPAVNSAGRDDNAHTAQLVPESQAKESVH